jgi:hypothetical protein
MRFWAVPFRLLAILGLAALVSGVWLFRRPLLAFFRPRLGQLQPGSGPSPANLAKARDKIDSLNAWRADSVVLTPGEAASLLVEGLPREARRHLDSLRLVLGDGAVTLSGRLETAQIPGEALGPLAGALDPWERVSASGPLVFRRPGSAEWRVRALTLRGFTLPESATRRLVDWGLPGSRGGTVPIDLPPGLSGLRVRPRGVAVYGTEAR